MEINELVGVVLTSIEGAKEDNDEILFTVSDGTKFKMYHCQDCCEHVRIRQIDGDVNDLIGHPLTMAEEWTNSDDPRGETQLNDSFLWTFYKFATIKGYVTITWLGESNGYYSESVEFEKMS